VEHLADLGAAINVVTEEDDLATFVVVKAFAVGVVSQLREKIGEFVMVSVDVAD
jgi:hypothetical protein